MTSIDVWNSLTDEQLEHANRLRDENMTVSHHHIVQAVRLGYYYHVWAGPASNQLHCILRDIEDNWSGEMDDHVIAYGTGDLFFKDDQMALMVKLKHL